MLGQSLITFRETLEAALLISIVIAYLARTGKDHYSRYIWYGTAAAIAASLILGLTVWAIYGGLSEANATLFEGMAALIAVAVLTSMILWMAFKSKTLKRELQQKVDIAVERGTLMALITTAFILVFREGFETVLFLTPFAASDGFGTMAGFGAGLSASLAFTFLVFSLGKNIDIRKFFYFSSLLLIFLAAGLFGYGIHELIEYREAVGSDPGWFGAVAYDLGIAKDSIFYHKGALGSIPAVLFGYSVKMEVGRVIGHVLYLGIFLPLTIVAYRKPELIESFGKNVASLKRGFWQGKRTTTEK